MGTTKFTLARCPSPKLPGLRALRAGEARRAQGWAAAPPDLTAGRRAEGPEARNGGWRCPSYKRRVVSKCAFRFSFWCLFGSQMFFGSFSFSFGVPLVLKCCFSGSISFSLGVFLVSPLQKVPKRKGNFTTLGMAGYVLFAAPFI